MLAKPDYIQGAEIIDITAARGMGDNINAAKAEYINRRREIWAARVPAAVKIIALAILEHMSSEKLECTASKARLAYMCNMPPKTFDRHYNAAKALFHYHERKGKTTIFSPRMLDVAKELAKIWAPDQQSRTDPNRYKPSPKLRGGQNGPSPKMTLPHFGQTPPQIEGDTPPQIGGPKRQVRDQLEETVCSEGLHGVQETPKKSKSKKTPPETYSDDFEKFWLIYPSKKAKGEASASWERLSMAQKRRAYAALKAQLPELTARKQDPRGNYCPYPSTWLNQGRYDDDVESPQKPNRTRPRDPNDMTPEEYREYLEKGFV